MSRAAADLEQLVALLEPIDDFARRQRWDGERPWRVQTHIGIEGGVVVVDLHDLSAKNTKRLLRLVLDAISPDGVQAGAVAFVTGRGRHSAGDPVLKGIVASRLQAVAADHTGWSVHVLGAGRVSLVTDATTAPGQAANRLGWGFWLLAAGLVAAAVWACLGTPGVG